MKNPVKEIKDNINEPLKGLVSLPVSIWNSVFKRYRLGDFLPWAFWDDEDRVYINNDNTYGAVFECAPRIRMGVQTAEAIEEMLHKLPDDTYIQFMLYGSPNIVNLVEKWKNSHLVREEELLNELIKATAEMYYKKTKEPITKSFTPKLKNYRFFISIKGKDKDEVINYKNTLEGILEANRFAPFEMSPKELKPLLYEIFNINHDIKNIPGYDDTMPLNRQIIAPNTAFIVKDGHIESDNKYWISLVPQKLQEYASIIDFSEKLGDYTTKNPETSQFQDNFFITLSVRKLPKKQTDLVKGYHTTIVQQKWNRVVFRKFAAVQDESIEILDRIDKNKETLYAMDLNILVAGDTLKEAKKHAQVVKSFWSKGGKKKGIHLEEALGIHHLNFIASLPIGINDEYVFEVTKKYRSMFLKNICQYVPAEADYQGEGDNFLLITRRAQLAAYDLFKSPASFNAYVVAGSGAGKSVFLQTIALNSYARGDRIFVLDYDNSFFGLCQAIDAQYIALNPNKPISFNPFSEIKSEEQLQEDLAYLSEFIYMLGASKSEIKSLEEEKLIKSIIQKTIVELYKQYGEKLEITHIHNKLNQLKDPRFQDFAMQLSPFCRSGLYGKFFEGPNQFNIKKEFIAVEFKEMSEHPDIRDPIVMMLVYHINQMMYSAKDRRSRIQIILDEAHRFLGKNPRMDDFIEQAYRRARKYNGSIILATQGFDDIYDPNSGGLSPAGKVIIANSPWKFFLKQEDTSINMLIKSGVFNFDKIDEKIIRTIHTKKGEYSEIFVMTPEGFKIPNRLIMNRFFYYITTTDPKDKEKIKKYTDLGYDYIEAIKKVIEEEE